MTWFLGSTTARFRVPMRQTIARAVCRRKPSAAASFDASERDLGAERIGQASEPAGLWRFSQQMVRELSYRLTQEQNGLEHGASFAHSLPHSTVAWRIP